ncbi:MAG: DUF4960 domain-containing protein [Muribaculaceae bacterium]
MKTYIKSLYFALLALMAVTVAACSDDNKSNLDLDGDTAITAITVSGYEGTIDEPGKAIVAYVATSVDLSNLTIDAITLSPGATCDYPAGTHFNGSIPRNIHVVNGDVECDYTLTVKHDNVEFLSFVLDGSYEGSIDNSAHTITVFVPMGTDITAMQATFKVTEGATVTPETGSVIDFSAPVKFVAELRTARVEYLVTVIPDDMSQEPKAFVGNKASADLLDVEAAAAYRWMIENVPNVTYVAVQDLIDNKVKLDDFKMVWCHLDFTDWPSQMWDSRDIFNSYWLRGGAILASRDGARYINDVWRIARDQQSPNDMYGGDSYTTLADDLGFTITGHESHPLYSGLTADANGRVLLLAAGCSNSGRTLCWHVDWSPYNDMAGWQERTGATALASSDSYDANIVTIAEFEPYEALKGYTTGRVITIGTPAYEWYDKNGANNPYRDNIITLTKNAINYLCQ